MSDLSKSEEEHWSETQNRHRRGIKKALKMDVVTKIERLTRENAVMFSNIYKETMAQVKADQYYFFDDDYFFNLLENLQDRILLITAYQDNKAIGSSIYTICKESGIMQFHLGGTLNAYTHLQPSKLITHVARDWGRTNHYKLLHLGGGVGSNLDSLYEYKKGFSSQELLFKTYRLVVNPAKYEALVADSWFTENDLRSDFFPLYRKEPTKERILETEQAEALADIWSRYFTILISQANKKAAITMTAFLMLIVFHFGRQRAYFTWFWRYAKRPVYCRHFYRPPLYH